MRNSVESCENVHPNMLKASQSKSLKESVNSEYHNKLKMYKSEIKRLLTKRKSAKHESYPSEY